MVILKVRNGLGNQMFIYALGAYISEKYNLDVYYDMSELIASNPQRNINHVNDIFKKTFPEAPLKIIRKYTGRRLYFKYSEIKNRHIRFIASRICNIQFPTRSVIWITEPNYWNVDLRFVDSILDYNFDYNKNYYLIGFWENMAYLSCVNIRELFVFKKGIQDSNPYIKYVNNPNSVALHIRRGDYISGDGESTFPHYIYNLCDESYYIKSIELIESMVEDPLFIVFTDDPEYVAREYKWLKKIVVTGNKDYEDMHLISLCKHCILANSTFSFWGAMLNSRKGIIVAPKYHYIHCESKTKVFRNLFFHVENWNYIDNLPDNQEGVDVCH